MLCFPAVLFAGAMVPDRWAFEAIARHVDLATLTAGTPHASLGSSPASTYWLALSGFIVVLGVAARSVVAHRATSRG